MCSYFPVPWFVNLSPLPEAGDCHFVGNSTHRNPDSGAPDMPVGQMAERIGIFFLVFLGHSSWTQNTMFLWGGLQRKVFPLWDSSAHRTQGVNLRAALKAGQGRRSLPASAKAFEAWHPLSGNCKHQLLATAPHSTELHAPSSYAPGSALSWTLKRSCAAEWESACL